MPAATAHKETRDPAVYVEVTPSPSSVVDNDNEELSVYVAHAEYC